MIDADPQLVLGSIRWLVDGIFYVAFLLYFLFAGLVVVQVSRMRTAIQTQFDAGVRLISWVHFLMASGALLLAFVVL